MMRVFYAAIVVLFMVISASAQTRVAAIVVTFPSSIPPRADAMTEMAATMGQVDTFYSAQSYGHFLVQSDVFGVYEVPLDGTATRADIAREAKAALAGTGVDLSVYGNHFVYISPQTSSVGAGYGDGAGVWIAIAPNQVRVPQFPITGHELGHHFFGLNHARGTICTDGTPLGTAGGTCSNLQYGDSLDIMGQGTGHFNAITKSGLGWLNAVDVISSGDYWLEPFEAMSGTNTLHLKGSKQALYTYWIEYRRASPYPLGAVVHIEFLGSLLLAMNSSSGTVVIDSPALRVGQTYCDKDARLSFSVVSMDETGLLLRVRFGGKCL